MLSKFLHILLVLVILMPAVGLAQMEITGKVADARSGTPIPRVSIGPDSSHILTHTDENGRFKLTLPQRDSVLHFFHLGYRSRKIRIGSELRLHITLRPLSKSTREVLVEGFATDEPVTGIGASVERSGAEDLERYHNGSLRPALNSMPGVRMDSRGIGGSSRLSIRGSKLRSPWGVRNVKAYWNGMPLTSPDGSTPLEVIDPLAVGNVEVIKGPSGSLYGAGNGGVIKFQSKQAEYGQRYVRSEGMIGSYGMERELLELGAGSERVRFHLHYGRVRNGGYREQEFVNRDHLRINTSFYVNEKNSIELFGYYFDGKWGLPGGLSRSEFRKNPRQAVPFSVKGNASFQHRTGRLGVKHTHFIGKGWKHSLVLYSGQGAKENPYGTSPYYHGYKLEDHRDAGYRNQLEWEKKFGKIRTHLVLGSEGRTSTNDLRNFDNEQGQPGDIRENSTTRSRIGLLFVQSKWYLPWDIKLTLGASYDRVEYRHRDHFQGDSVDRSGRFSFDPAWVPRFSLLKGFGKDFSFYASWSEGFSAPTVWELIDPDGSINRDLQAENGRNYELGFRGGLFSDRLAFDLTAYWFRLRGAILPEERISGKAVFANIGRTEQKGLEASLDLRILRKSSGILRAIDLEQGFALQEFVFGDFIEKGRNFKGKRIPGVPYQTWDQSLSIRGAHALYLDVTGRYVGDTPLNNANTAFMDAYYVLGGKLGWEPKLGDRFRAHLYGGVHNALDTKYSAFLQVNDLNGNYFNPAPARMWYGGIGLRYSF
ncbi:MAG: TonB-dependent receptor [Flavobacteriales bacterium]